LCIANIANEIQRHNLNKIMSRMTFKEFMQMMGGDGMAEEKDDIQKTLGKLPKSHAALVKGYRWKFHAGNTLNGDDEHVGYIDDGDQEIAVAGPWNYGREFTILHEVGHKVWENFVDPHMRQMWSQIVSRTKHKQNQNPEELFCMAYANEYVKNKIVIHTHKEWSDFIKRLPQ
jgi:hypothetical protein